MQMLVWKKLFCDKMVWVLSCFIHRRLAWSALVVVHQDTQTGIPAPVAFCCQGKSFGW